MATMDGINSVQAYNVHTIAIQVPISDLTKNGSTPTNPMSKKAVIGVWSTASRRKSRMYDGKSGTYVGRGPWKQVSRLGNPLFNEVIVPMAEKDKWNSRPPRRDRKYTKYVNKPELAGLLPALYPGAFPNLAAYNEAAGRPQRDPDDRDPRRESCRGSRTSPGPTQADMLRLNVAIPPSNSPNDLGLVAGDAAGYPNGRRINDDVVTIELRAVAGLTIPLVDPSYTADGAVSAVADGTTNTNATVTGTFPYLGLPGGGYQTEPGTTAAADERADGEPACRAGLGPARHRRRRRCSRGHHAREPGRRGGRDPSRRPGGQKRAHLTTTAR